MFTLIHHAYRAIKGSLANSAEPDQTPQNADCDQSVTVAFSTGFSINQTPIKLKLDQSKTPLAVTGFNHDLILRRHLS